MTDFLSVSMTKKWVFLTALVSVGIIMTLLAPSNSAGAANLNPFKCICKKSNFRKNSKACYFHSFFVQLSEEKAVIEKFFEGKRNKKSGTKGNAVFSGFAGLDFHYEFTLKVDPKFFDRKPVNTGRVLIDATGEKTFTETYSCSLVK